MLTTFIRSVILFVFIVFSLRLMGKRQIGQLQPAELVVTILLSEMAATPMQDNDIPMLNTLVAICVLVGFEIIMSALCLKSTGLRTLLQGNSVVLINDGKVDRKKMKQLRFTVDDLLEALRQKDVFDISDVQYAVAETDGSLSVLLKSEKQPVCAEDICIKKPPSSLPVTIVSDGSSVTKSSFLSSQLTEDEIKNAVGSAGVPTEDIFLMTLDKHGNKVLIKKEDADG